MKQKKYYFIGMHPHQFNDGTNCHILWYRCGGMIRGELRFKTGTEKELLSFASGMQNFNTSTKTI